MYFKCIINDSLINNNNNNNTNNNNNNNNNNIPIIHLISLLLNTNLKKKTLFLISLEFCLIYISIYNIKIIFHSEITNI